MSDPTQRLAQLQPELLSAERILWSGQPSRSVIFHSTDWLAIPFSLLWGGFALFWEFCVTHSRAGHPVPFNWFMTLWGIPFVLAGQYIIWGRFFYIAWQKRRVYYALTNKRVLVLVNGISRKVIGASLSSLTSVSLSTRTDGIGTIAFAPSAAPEGSGFGSRRRTGAQIGIRLASLTFHDLPDASAVYRRIEAERQVIAHSDGNPPGSSTSFRDSSML